MNVMSHDYTMIVDGDLFFRDDDRDGEDWSFATSISPQPLPDPEIDMIDIRDMRPIDDL